MEKLNRTVQFALYKLRGLDWQSRAGLLLMIFGLLFLLAITLPKAYALKAFKADLAKLKNTRASVSHENRKPDFDITEQFYALLPAQKDVNVEIAQILKIAADSGLQIEKVEYASQSAASSALLKYQIKLPLSGTYMQIRQFINQTLNSQPSLALTDVNFRRDDIGTDLVESNILFTLYLKQGKS